MVHSKKIIVVFAALLLLATSLRAQEDRRGNPLRLTADPTARPAPPSSNSSAAPRTSAILAEMDGETLDRGRQSATMPRPAEIPAEIHQILFPQQSSKQITVVASSDNELNQGSPIPSTPPVQPPVHIEPSAAHVGTASYPHLPRPQTSVMPATHVDARTEQTLADFLAESNSAHQRLESTLPPPTLPMAVPSQTTQATANLPLPILPPAGNFPAALPLRTNSSSDPAPHPSTQTRWDNSNLGAPTEAEIASPTISKKKSPSSEDFQALLQKIATSTCIVLVLGVGFLFVAKRWVSGRGAPARKSSNNSSSAQPDAATFRIISQLRLSAKANLKLIEIGDQRVLVASDLNGIKSVVPLNTPFADALADYSEEVASEMGRTTDREMARPTSDRQTTFQANRQPDIPSAAGTYTPAARASTPAKKSTEEIEAEMQRKLSELLGGEAFKDVFYKANKANRAVA